MALSTAKGRWSCCLVHGAVVDNDGLAVLPVHCRRPQAPPPRPPRRALQPPSGLVHGGSQGPRSLALAATSLAASSAAAGPADFREPGPQQRAPRSAPGLVRSEGPTVPRCRPRSMATGPAASSTTVIPATIWRPSPRWRDPRPARGLVHDNGPTVPPPRPRCRPRASPPRPPRRRPPPLKGDVGGVQEGELGQIVPPRHLRKCGLGHHLASVSQRPGRRASRRRPHQGRDAAAAPPTATPPSRPRAAGRQQGHIAAASPRLPCHLTHLFAFAAHSREEVTAGESQFIFSVENNKSNHAGPTTTTPRSIASGLQKWTT